MKHFNSKPININKPASEVFERLSDLNNFKDLMPKDKLESIDSTATTSTIVIKSGYKITLSRREFVKDKKIVYGTVDGKPVDMTIGFDINEKPDGKSVLIVNIDAAISGFLANMMSKPLENMLDMMSNRLENELL